MKDALYGAHVAERKATVAQALAQTGFDRLLVHSGVPHTYFADDNDAPFRSTPHFTHWAPVEGPDHLLAYVPGDRPRLYRVTPRDFWYAPPAPVPDFVGAQVDVTDVATPEEAWAAACPSGGGRTAFVGAATDRAEANGIAADCLNPKGLVARLDWERSYKSAYEVETLAEATVKAARGFRTAEKAFLAGASELEIHQAYLAAAGTTEEALPYTSIIALDERSATLHYHGKRGREAAPGEVLLVDAGASVRGYGSDITRTFTAPHADATFRFLVDGMDRLQRRLCLEARPGLPYLELHLLAHRLIGGLLAEAGIVKVGADEAFDRGLTHPFFPHGLGHFLGVQVHDVSGRQADREGSPAPPPPAHRFLRTTRVIEERMVFTIEPGLYFIPMLLEPFREGPDAGALDWELIDRLTPSGGIRIEDDLVVGAAGNRNLTRPELP